MLLLAIIFGFVEPFMKEDCVKESPFESGVVVVHLTDKLQSDIH